MLVVSVNAINIEQTETIISRDTFETGYEDDFERILRESERSRAELARQRERAAEELIQARNEFNDELKTRRDEVKSELKKARQLTADIEERIASEELTESAKENQPEDGRAFGADRVHAGAALTAVVIAGSVLPPSFRGQIGTSLMASGKKQNAVNGYLLSGGGRGTQILKETLEKLTALGSGWSLSKEALGDLGKIFVDSGVDPESARGLITKLSQGDLSLENVLMAVGKADELAGSGFMGEAAVTALTASPAGLNNLAQFLSSLGLSTEAVKAVTSDLAPGQSFSSFDLRAILSKGGDEILAPLLTDGDLPSLVTALRGLGADESTINNLSVLISQSQGGATLEDLLGLLAFSEQPRGLSVSPQTAVKDIQILLTQTSKDSELTRMPVFNEIMLKLTLLGDREMADDFSALSPALQALRGGLSVLRDGQGAGAGGQGGGQQSADKRREERLMALNGINSETVGRGLESPRFQSAAAGQGGGYAAETLARQISQKLIYTVSRGFHRLRMDLAPESLGRLDVELKVKDDKLTAFIKADSLEAYEALEQEMSSLKSALREAGLTLSLTLSYDGQGGREGGQMMARSGYREEPSGGGTEIDNESGTAGINPPIWEQNSYLLDRVV
jgi:hypothetical protein